jgi:predicted MPP superfamily phosphohydrolase
MLLLNLLALLLLSAGQAFVLVTLVNRSHALPIRRERLRHIRHVHDLLVPLFPVILFWRLGFAGPKLLLGGSWSDVPWYWWIYLAICAAGLLGLIHVMARHLSRREPPVLESNHSQVTNIAKRLGRRPIGKAPFAWMLRLPLNEALTVDVNTKTLRLPRLPADWDGATILHISDWHFMGHVDLAYYEQVVELLLAETYDMVIFTGDLIDREELSAWVPGTLGRLSAPLGCYFILGNHDWYFDDGAIRRQLGELGWIDVAERTLRVERNGAAIVLAGDETPWMGQHPQWPAGDEFRLLLSHTPDNLPLAREQRVDLVLAGHNHGGQVVLPLYGPVYAPSRYGVKYAGGVYWEAPTAMHVSRGLSGRHPLRFRCRPEATRLVLKRG